MATNKTQPTDVPVEQFVAGLAERRAAEARDLIAVCREVTGTAPVMWGQSIIGFGSRSYETSRGTEETPRLAFAPRSAHLSIYIPEGVDAYDGVLGRLGPHRTSVGCLNITRLGAVDRDALREVLRSSWERWAPADDVERYVSTVPAAARPHFDELRRLVRAEAGGAREKISYGILGYVPPGKKSAAVYISGFKDHVAIYPAPAGDDLAADLAPYRRGKGTVWFALGDPLPADLIRRVVRALLPG